MYFNFEKNKDNNLNKIQRQKKDGKKVKKKISYLENQQGNIRGIYFDFVDKNGNVFRQHFYHIEYTKGIPDNKNPQKPANPPVNPHVNPNKYLNKNKKSNNLINSENIIIIFSCLMIIIFCYYLYKSFKKNRNRNKSSTYQNYF